MTEMFFMFFVISLVVNGLLGWYVVRLLRKYVPISEDLEDLFEHLDEYHFHIKTVSEMESFYGEEILLNLLRHSRAVVQEVDEFRAAYSLLDEYEDFDEFEEGEIDGDQKEENDINQEKEILGVVHSRR